MELSILRADQQLTQDSLFAWQLFNSLLQDILNRYKIKGSSAGEHEMHMIVA